MFIRHSIAAAALLVTTFSAQADVVSVAGAPTLNGGSFAALLAASNTSAGLYLVRGVEGLYILASRTISQPADVEMTIAPAPALADAGASADSVAAPALAAVAAEIVAAPALAASAADVMPGAAGGSAIPDTPILIGTTTPLEADADPIVNAAEVPEPSSIALLLAGVLGAAGFTRARKQS